MGYGVISILDDQNKQLQDKCLSEQDKSDALGIFEFEKNAKLTKNTSKK